MLIQIYEIQSRAEAKALMDMGVDHIGSVLTSPGAPGNDELLKTVRFVSEAGGRSSLIPLFTDVDQISSALDIFRPSIVHFCEALIGNEAVRIVDEALERQRTIRMRFPELEVMRSVPIARAGHAHEIPSLEIAKTFEPESDFFLTDTILNAGISASESTQPVDGFVGITGETCDWNVARALVQMSGIPVILAGGISPDNVDQGMEDVSPAGVDSCTLTNAVDEGGRPIRFRKDMEKVKRMVEIVRKKELKKTN